MTNGTNDELPESWTECTLGEVTPYGSTKKVEPSEIPLDAWILELEDVEKDTSRIIQRFTFRERKSKSTKNRFEAGDVLYGKLRPYLNKVVLADDGGYCTTEIIPLKSTAAVQSKYLFYWLKHPLFLAYVTEVSHGLNMPRLGTDAGKAAPFVLAPLAEQKRIADKLEAVLGRVDACRARLDRVPALLKRFRQSVLAAAVSGKLTESWREETPTTSTSEQLICRIFEERAKRYEAVCKGCISVGNKPPKKPKNLTRQTITRPGLPEIPESWQWVCWDDITDWITYGFTRPMPHVDKGIPIITAKNVRDGFLDFTHPEQTTKEAFLSLSEKDKPRRNEILITKDGAIRGRAGLVETDEPFCISQSVAVLRFGGMTAHEPFLLQVIQDKFTQNLIEEESSGMAIPHLSITNFGRFPVPIPPLPEQQEIVRRVEALFAFADRIEARLATAQKTVERLTPATLAKAFRGELVPQDPNDEPASVLLERLRTSTPSAPVKSRREGKSRGPKL